MSKWDTCQNKMKFFFHDRTKHIWREIILCTLFFILVCISTHEWAFPGYMEQVIC